MKKLLLLIQASSLALLGLPGSSLAQTTTTAAITTTDSVTDSTITPVPSSSPTTATLLRPSSGETITAGGLYTVRWTPPPPGPLAIEANSYYGDVFPLVPGNEPCEGWLINTGCRKFNITIPSRSTSYVWNLTSPYGVYTFDYTGMTSVQLGVYVDDLEYGDLPSSDAPWYVNSSFTVTKPPSESDGYSVSIGYGSPTPTTDGANTTPTVTGDPTKPNGAASRTIRYGGIWNMGAILTGGWILTLLLE